MDLVIKRYFDRYRLNNELPPEVQGKMEGKLFSDIATLEKWRNWRNSNLRYEDKAANAVLIGALDDCLVERSYHIPLDYKTRGSELKGDPRKYYQNQLDCYCLMLESCGFKTKGIAYLLYYWPLEVRQEGVVKFHVEPIRIETDIESAKRIVQDAARLLSGPIPKSGADCEYCNLVAKRQNVQLEFNI
ncbi:MAG: PD-(D/E)XK nuclease family protein [Omnitrophica bacterium]|nr:PD-(D/E)XK nuclease family protein [Candidatus Omnitrophota bacterium]